ncbi:hypothetical protein [Halalkalibacter akibai]|uniref:Uncharacterized protein n=1 Tax=Halalkalibacter akibai (strain ATCC 43226 / DSM 21942 / CIP 109018 / JCM 9157 / 1139) TaxID=1236973 RepID=W4QP78_HALA3|nr:hypothetical protein [Halalkalibacter akibai]GAE33448.1 hypothetical protein JCM9157_451 [Halalkalibacter akibai JCM 9157]
MNFEKEVNFMLEIALIALFSLAALLFILSYFRKDKTAELEKQIEQMSITHMQEMYQLKSKVRFLEEELLLSAEQSSLFRQNTSNAHNKLYLEITSLYEKGLDSQSIASKTQLTIDEVNRILEPYFHQTRNRGI